MNYKITPVYLGENPNCEKSMLLFRQGFGEKITSRLYSFHTAIRRRSYIGGQRPAVTCACSFHEFP